MRAVSQQIAEGPHVTLVVKMPRAYANGANIQNVDLTDLATSLIATSPLWLQLGRVDKDIDKVAREIGAAALYAMADGLAS